MPFRLSISLGILGALAGAGLTLMTSFDGFGLMTFYVSGAIVAIGVSAGAILAYTLTGMETQSFKRALNRRRQISTFHFKIRHQL